MALMWLHAHAHRASDFCFAPYGGGYGNRLPHIAIGGCVPVTVQVRLCEQLWHIDRTY